jgi:hypothetical protein
VSAAIADRISDRVFRIIADGQPGPARRIAAIAARPIGADECNTLLRLIGAMGRRMGQLEAEVRTMRDRLADVATEAERIEAEAASLTTRALWLRRSASCEPIGERKN